MAPDKIYLLTDETEGFVFTSKRTDNKGVEYIRKDFLLELAKQKQYDSTTIVADNFWQEVIDKINTL